MTRIFLFLDNAEQIYHLSCMSKACRNALTPEVIIRAAVFGGGRIKRTMEQVMNLVERQAIHVPSSFRLLRLLNATRCERMEHCLGYDLVKEKSSMVRDSNRPFGMCICRLCLKGISATLLGYQAFDSPDHDRVARYDHTRMMTIEQVEHKTGDRVGSVVMGWKIVQVQKTYWGAARREERKQALADLFSPYDDSLSNCEKARREKLVDMYLVAKAEYDPWLASKGKMWGDFWRAKAEEQRARRIERLTLVLDQIKSFLGEDNDKDWDWALEGEFSDYSGYRSFKYGPTTAVLGRVMSAPSYFSKVRLKVKCQELCEAYEQIKMYGFGCGTASTFLSFLRDSSVPHEVAFYEYRESFVTEFTEKDIFIRCDETFLEKLREGNPFHAFFRLLTWDDKRNVFVHSVVEEQADDQTTELFRKMARSVWGVRSSMWSNAPSTVADYRTKYDESKEEYETLSQNMKDYLKLKSVRAFLHENGPPENRPHQTYTRKDALKYLFSLKGYDCKHYLESRQFKELLAHHKRIFSNPNRYSLY